MAFPNNIPSTYVPPSIAATKPANPTAPASTSAFKMQGLGALITPYTPVANVLALFSATLTDAAVTVGEGIILQLWYGAVINGVAPPANAAAIPANAIQLGPNLEWASGVTLTTAADLFQPVSMFGIAQSLTPGQQYWFDIAAESVIGASQVAITNPWINLIEIA